MSHPRDRKQLKRHAAEQALRRKRASSRGPALESADPHKVYVKHRGICGICHKRIPPRAKFHVEHRIPIVRGGTEDDDNVRPAHETCNLEKSDK